MTTDIQLIVEALANSSLLEVQVRLMQLSLLRSLLECHLSYLSYAFCIPPGW